MEKVPRVAKRRTIAQLEAELAQSRGELAERTLDLQESLEYQTAISEVLNVISQSTFDLQPVLDTLVATARGLCNADMAMIYRRQGDAYRLAANLGFPAEYEAFARNLSLTPSRASVTQRAALERRFSHVPDITADPEYALPEAAELGKARTALGVPLLREGEPIGVFTLARERVEPFAERQIELVRTFSDQAVIAIENTRLLTELRESLEQQSATAEVLQVINSSPGELQPVFEVMLDKAMRLCGASHGELLTYDGERFHTWTLRGFTPAFIEIRKKTSASGKPGSISGRILETKRPVHVLDLMAEDAYGTGLQTRRAAVDVGGSRSALAVPLLKDDHVLGVIMLAHLEVRPFSDKQIALLQNFAQQAVIAMENARLLGELQARTRDLEESLEYQTATSNVLNVISRSTADVQPVLDTVAETATRLCSADAGSVFIREGEVYRAVSSSLGVAELPGYWAKLRQRGFVPGRDSTTGRVALEGRVVHIEDIRADPDFAVPETVAAGIRTNLGVPLLRERVVIGTINLGRKRVEPFTERQIELVRTFADQAVIAIENARLLTETREALEQQTATSDVLKVISQSTFELEPVLQTVLDTAMRLCGNSQGSIFRLSEDGLYRQAVGSGMQPEYYEIEAQQEIRPGSATLVGRTAAAARPIQIADAWADPDYAPKEDARVGQLRSMLGIPLLREGTPIGVICTARTIVKPFTEKEIELVATFADQAVIAIENARLLGEIQQRQAELRATFDNMVDGVAMFDQELRLTAWNRNFQELLDLPDDLLAERPGFDTYIRYLTGRGEFGVTDPETEIVRLRSRLGDHYSFERTRPDGTVIEVRNNPMPDGGVVVIYSDITERKRSEEEIRAARDVAEAAYRDLQAAQASLVQAQKMAALGQLTAGIAHEIKNPLNFVNNFASLSTELLGELKEEAGPALATLDAKQREGIDETIDLLTGNLDKIIEHGQRADNIVKSMLEHSRGASGERREVNLNALVDEALNLAYHGARAQDSSFNITLERDYAPALAPLELAPQEMTRVFLNLIGNGFYAADQRAKAVGQSAYRPTLSIATLEADHAVEVRVRDNGTGIPAEIRDKLFQPFFTTKPTGEGTGLGLSISYDIVTQQHGGTIEVNSEEGRFTEFTIRLPRKQPPTGASA